MSHILSHQIEFGGNLRNFDQNRQAHNLKVAGSNPAPATKKFHKINDLHESLQSSDCGLFSILSLKRVSILSHLLSLAVRFMPFLLQLHLFKNFNEYLKYYSY